MSFAHVCVDVHFDPSCNTIAWLSCFQQNASLHQFEEQPVERLFPELQQLPSKLVSVCLVYVIVWLCAVSNWVAETINNL